MAASAAPGCWRASAAVSFGSGLGSSEIPTRRSRGAMSGSRLAIGLPVTDSTAPFTLSMVVGLSLSGAAVCASAELEISIAARAASPLEVRVVMS